LAQFLYALTLPNINRFSKLFYSQNQEKICNNAITKDFVPIFGPSCIGLHVVGHEFDDALHTLTYTLLYFTVSKCFFACECTYIGVGSSRECDSSCKMIRLRRL